ncbi:MAG: hypothetical protein ABR574_06185 [Cryomorphaceae bacterium]|nr:hypothetical protein [Flavobacteriales bacterium]
MYRQGDVLLEKIDEIPKRKTTKETLLVRGEGRNHGHFISGDELDIFEGEMEETTSSGGLVTHYLNVQAEAVLEHKLIASHAWTGEHAPILLPPGRYRVIKQREYNPFSRAIRAVKD